MSNEVQAEIYNGEQQLQRELNEQEDLWNLARSEYPNQPESQEIFITGYLRRKTE